MLENCDKCGSKIINNECSCGVWTDSYDEVAAPYKYLPDLFEFFLENKEFEYFSSDYHKGICVVFFKGDYEMCMKVNAYIEHLQHQDKE